MKIILVAVALSLSAIALCQEAGKSFSFKQAGWTIILPEGFTAMDSAENAERMAKGKKIVEETNDITADVSSTITLIAATKNYNYFNSTITPFDPQKDGAFDRVAQGTKELLYRSFAENMAGGKMDSASSSETIDGMDFDKFRITASINGKTLFNMILLTKFYNGYDFGITYLYVDTATKEQIENMLKNSRFEK